MLHVHGHRIDQIDNTFYERRNDHIDDEAEQCQENDQCQYTGYHTDGMFHFFLISYFRKDQTAKSHIDPAHERIEQIAQHRTDQDRLQYSDECRTDFLKSGIFKDHRKHSNTTAKYKKDQRTDRQVRTNVPV